MNGVHSFDPDPDPDFEFDFDIGGLPSLSENDIHSRVLKLNLLQTLGG